MTRSFALRFMLACEKFLESVEVEGGLTPAESRMIERYTAILHDLLPPEQSSSADENYDRAA